MFRFKTLAAGLGLALIGAVASFAPVGQPQQALAADHGDAPNVASDSGIDIADVYFFLDPNDNANAILICTIHGFIVPGEAVNFGAFDENMLYRFTFETTGDARPESNLDVTFSPRGSAGTNPSTATIKLPFGGRKGTTFTAPTTPQTLAATPATRVITDGPMGIKFFAGPADDPFFFDIPGFSRFTASVAGGTPNPALLQRGRDSFAGYNVLAIAFSIPKALFVAPTNNTVGVTFSAQRRTETPTALGTVKSKGKFRQKDRMANPAVNVVLIPFPRKTEYNGATPLDDAKGRFANSIVTTLTTLGTTQANIDTLASVAITNGDYLRLNLLTPNTGPGGGGIPIVEPNPATLPDASRLTDPAGFPNGRRLRDDVVDILTFIVTNGLTAPSTAITTGDNTFASDVAPGDVFPFLALPQQPRENPTVPPTAGNLTIEDNTRN